MTPRTHKAATDTAALDTEQSNSATRNLDALSPLEIARVINAEDARVAGAVRKALPQIARAMDAIARALSQGGRLIYVGTGSSGRLGALDASECPPTFNTDPKTVQFLMAGGVRALGAAVEANEDSTKAGRRDMARRKPNGRDCVVGIAASGRTPYTIAAVEYARQKGATTIALVCNRNTALERAAEIPIVVEVGPEAVTGSTRMKAGTAQKMVLNMLSTGAMARLGYVYGNLMVNLHLKNSKLVERGIRMLQLAAGLSHGDSLKVLRKAGSSVPVAIVMAKRHVTRARAELLLKKSGGNVRIAIDGASTRE
jgi:N-acetylmuramic acid 6-phosphate etherase